MPELPNTREEAFAVALSKDISASKAYVLAGFKPNRSNASQKAKQQRIRDRVAEIKAARAEVQAIATLEVIDRLVISKETVITELGKIGFGSVRHFLRTDANGDKTIDLTNATPFQLDAIQELTIDEFAEGRGKDARTVRRTKVKLYDKRAALVEIGKELGLFSIKDKTPFVEQVRNMTDDQRMAHAASLAERANRILEAAGLLNTGGIGGDQAAPATDAEYEDVEPSEGGDVQQETK